MTAHRVDRLMRVLLAFKIAKIQYCVERVQ